MDDANIRPILPIKSIPELEGKGKVESNDSSFKELLQNSIDEINKLHNKADQAIEKMASGEVHNAHQVMMAVEKANLTFSMMMQIRKKLLEAYKEIMKMGF